MTLEAVVFDFRRADHRQRVGDLRVARRPSPSMGTPCRWRRGAGSARTSTTSGSGRPARGGRGSRLRPRHFDRAYEAQDRPEPRQLPALPGVVEVAERWRRPGSRWRSPPRRAAWLEPPRRAARARQALPVLIGADVVGGVGKPAPDVYLAACADLGADPATAVALEDSPTASAAQGGRHGGGGGARRRHRSSAHDVAPTSHLWRLRGLNVTRPIGPSTGVKAGQLPRPRAPPVA